MRANTHLPALIFASAMLSAAPIRAQEIMTFVAGSCATGFSESRGTTYTEAGFALTSKVGFTSWCADNADYAGPAILIASDDGTGLLSKVGGGTFSIESIDLAHVFSGSFAAQSFKFTGNVFGGGTVSQIFTVAAQSGTPSFDTFTFASTFTNLTSVGLAQQEPAYYQFTNVRLDVVATPEPASLTLVGTGLFALIAIARCRKIV